MTELNLKLAQDVATFRKRVNEELVELSYRAVVRMAVNASGHDAARFVNRHAAIRAIADKRIAEILASEAKKPKRRASSPPKPTPANLLGVGRTKESDAHRKLADRTVGCRGDIIEGDGGGVKCSECSGWFRD